MEVIARSARANAWQMTGLSDVDPHADTAAQHGTTRRHSERPTRRPTTGCVGGCTGAFLILLVSCVLLSLAFPYEAQSALSSLKATIKGIGTERPYRTAALPTRITLWQGHLYASGPFGSTGVYAPDTGNLLSTFPGVVVGSDEQLLYLSPNRVPVSVANDGGVFFDGIARLPLVARDAHGAQLWTYPAGMKEKGAEYDYAPEVFQLQSQGDLVYVRLIDQVVALNKADGSVRWSSRNGYLGHSAQFVLAPQTLYLLVPRQVITLSARTGALLDIQAEQEVDTVGQVVTDVEGQVVYMSDELRDTRGLIIARRMATGAVLWQHNEPRPGRKYLLAARGGVLYALLDHPGQLVALNGATGHILWSAPFGGDEPSRATTFLGATPDVLFLALGAMGPNSTYGGLATLAFDTHSGKLRWQQRVSETPSVSLLDGQSIYSASLLHRRQVTTGGLGGPRDVANCRDSVGLRSLATTSGTFVWQRTTSLPCSRADSYF